LLDEQVRQAFAAILNESDDDIKDNEYEVEEVNDTDVSQEEPSGDTEESISDEADSEESEDISDVNGTESETEDVVESGDTADNADNLSGDTASEDEDEIGEDDVDFEKYKVSDNEYDFRNAKDDEIVKVYKRLMSDDQVTVVSNDDKVQISDNETGAEYIIDLSGNSNTSDENNDEIEIDDMKESRIYEIALNEYDSNVGYTDNYQKKDVMTSDGVSEPGNGRDIDYGVPHTTNKPWSSKKNAAPFNGEKGATVECGDVSANNNAPEVEETVAQKGGTNRMMGAKSHIPNTSCKNNPKKHAASSAGEYQQNEATIKKLKKVIEENKKIKGQLSELIKQLHEASVINVNLGGIIKLISENSTTKEEKRDIIDRFTNEVHTIEESQSLYKTISNELKKKPQVSKNINEDKGFGSSNADTINESKFYQDESLMGSLDLMHKICK